MNIPPDEAATPPGSTAGAGPGEDGEAVTAHLSPVVVETRRPLSQSILWRVQNSYYERTGVEAWSSGDVPFQLTSGPLLARVYTRLIEAFVADCLAGRVGTIDPEQPIYVIELGAGFGRLGFYCLEALQSAHVAPMKVVYVLTDRVQKNLDFWSGHELLRPLIDAGRADVARYEAGSDVGLHLEHSGVDLLPGEVPNPIVAVANYVFDVIPQDLYAVIGDSLYEELVEVVGEDREVTAATPDFFARTFLAPYRASAKPARYGDRIARVLAEVADARSGGRRRFLFPAVGIRTMDRLLDLAAGRMLLLVAERAEQELMAAPEAPGETAPVPPAAPSRRPVAERGEEKGSRVAYRAAVLIGMGVHGGSMSLPAELDIMARAARHVGGELLRSETYPSAVEIATMVAGDGGAATEVRECFRNVVEDIAPDDLFYTVKLALKDENPGLEGLLAALRASGYDPIAFIKCFDRLWKLLPAERPELNDEVVRVLERVIRLHFPFEDRGDLSGGAFALMARAGKYDEALAHFGEWREAHGARAECSYNVAMCHLGLQDPEAALVALEEAIALDPAYLPARQLRDSLVSERTFDDD